MKKYLKKVLVVLLVVILFTGCSCSLNDSKPEDAVETLFEKYRSKDDNVIEQLKDTITNETLTDDNKEKYQKLMEKQYESLGYVIKDTKKENDNATVTVEVTVLNYRDAVLKAEEELKNNPEKFNDEEGKFSDEKYMDYKIDQMNKVSDTTTYTLDLSLTKENGMWNVNDLSSDDISKIHGLY